MGMIERDPRDVNYIALYTAIRWYEEISSEIAIRIARGSSHRKPGQHLTPEILAEIKRIIDGPNFTGVNTTVRKYRINKYEIFEAIAKEKGIKQKYVGGEALIMRIADEGLKKASDWTKACEAHNCPNCIYDKITFGDYTLCDILIGLDFEGKNLVSHDDKDLHKNAQKCTKVKLEGKTKRMGFEVYENVLNELNELVSEHQSEKKKDIVSKVMLNGIKKLRRV
jgi:hypothetical protein